jgi:type IV secretion system protein VirD4
MQLSPSEEIVMISGVHPVRARKVRYYEDPQFQHRILKPSLMVPGSFATQPDDWSTRTPIPPSQELLAVLKPKTRDANGGHRREPELPQPDELVITSPCAETEFDAHPDDSDGDADAVQARALNGSMQGLARAVSLDPDDKMGL